MSGGHGPWLTIDHGDHFGPYPSYTIGVLQPGDTVTVAAGTYPVTQRGVELAFCSGNQYAPIHYVANGDVKIDATNAVRNPGNYAFGVLFSSVGYVVFDGFEIIGASEGACFNNYAAVNTTS